MVTMDCAVICKSSFYYLECNSIACIWKTIAIFHGMTTCPTGLLCWTLGWDLLSRESVMLDFGMGFMMRFLQREGAAPLSKQISNSTCRKETSLHKTSTGTASIPHVYFPFFAPSIAFLTSNTDIWTLTTGSSGAAFNWCEVLLFVQFDSLLGNKIRVSISQALPYYPGRWSPLQALLTLGYGPFETDPLLFYQLSSKRHR